MVYILPFEILNAILNMKGSENLSSKETHLNA